jgi:hypothetical protein
MRLEYVIVGIIILFVVLAAAFAILGKIPPAWNWIFTIMGGKPA